MKPLTTGRTIYDAQYVEGLKQPLESVIDCLIDANKLPFAASLKEISLILDYYIENVEK